MVKAYWVYGLCVDQHAIQIRTHVFWQPGLRTTEREGAFVWLELVCCPKPSAALSVMICFENNSSFLGADSQSWYKSSPAYLGTLRFVLSIWFCATLSSTYVNGFVFCCLWIFALFPWIYALWYYGIVASFVRYCALDLSSTSMDLCFVVFGFVLSFHGFMCCCTLDL